MTYKKILVAVDTTNAAEDVIKAAREVAVEHHATCSQSRRTPTGWTRNADKAVSLLMHSTTGNDSIADVRDRRYYRRLLSNTVL